MFTTSFWASTLERAVKTFAQTLVAIIGVNAAVPIWQVGWQEVLGVAATATVMSVLTSVASIGAGKVGTPSLVNGGTTATDGAVQGAQAAELAGVPTANPNDPLPTDSGSHRVEQ
ncbi:holin [Corynebacterium lipophiloflavum]|uniref:Holin n=1 Tax=Corynebacterium lipophiloflavum (strain ATCC 700352 / DSM 44291 / CCUG 37336 / JCM 10383 / DMMZ 1944) TaxID=525263 RepID=C0XU25_CORLD|nr:holin [Corynebacterium lipophiloflavum]EEI16251.1 hypothetical protein HMPREF0298_1945 [Corynebacterium lipophiloflavum DSM 44291]